MGNRYTTLLVLNTDNSIDYYDNIEDVSNLSQNSKEAHIVVFFEDSSFIDIMLSHIRY